MARELSKQQGAQGYYTERFGAEAQQSAVSKRVKQGFVCPQHHMVLNAHGICPMGCKPAVTPRKVVSTLPATLDYKGKTFTRRAGRLVDEATRFGFETVKDAQDYADRVERLAKLSAGETM